MTVVTAFVVGYLLLSLFATVILISACIVGGRFDRLSEPSSIFVPQESFAAVRTKTFAEAEVFTGELNRLMPQLAGQGTEQV
jgi:hypothetical protein